MREGSEVRLARRSKRPLPAWRQRYELKNPTISIRLTTAERDKLRATGAPASAVLRRGLQGLLAEREAVQRAYERGLRDAVLQLQCPDCGRPMILSLATAGELLQGQYSHTHCPGE